MMRRPIVLLLALLICGCQSQPIQVAQNASPVVRHQDWKKWQNFQPLETVSFGSFQVTRPNRTGVRNNVRQAAFSTEKLGREKVRQESKVDFVLEEDGVSMARVKGRSLRKFGRVATKIGNFNSDNFDLLDGTISLTNGPEATFEINNFHSRAPDAIALGKVRTGEHIIVVREIESSWHDSRNGFAGANCFLGDKRIAQVVLAPAQALIQSAAQSQEKETVWVDPQLPNDLRLTAAAMCATLLITERMVHHD